MYAFDFHRPATLRQANNLVGKVEDAKILAGGQTLLPTMKQRLASPAAVIDLSGVPELVGIEQKGRNLVIGAMTSHAEVASSALVRAALPGLAALAAGIGDPHVRHKGTIGGSIANNDPAADYPAGLLALGATIVTNRRKIPAGDFFTGMFSTALDEGEIITKVIVPTGAKFAYAKFRNPASRYAMVGVAVGKKGSSVVVAVTGAGSDGVFRWADAEAALGKRFNAKSLDGIKNPAAKELNSDIHASAEYRSHLIGVMARRAVTAATAK
ncbi:MAG: xanthine dehydrogenase family protein subunit M [Beijerinckiaceae bacterium]|nr:xanthine dehydrogenase family protein subunit M [Beijerinckiaceae bacterium]MCZ8301899.1 xanthine dehydrogenase family protein subunit M [Beijerinckiaceae bacterium]